MAADESQQALDAARARVDEVCADWRQGDVFRLDGLSPVVLADPAAPLTDQALSSVLDATADVDGIKLLWHDDEEFVVVSQDCDVVQGSAREPYISISPVITLEEQRSLSAAKGYMPGLAPIPAFGSDRFADLARVTSIEKSLLLGATRVARLRNEEESRLFRGVVHRHFSRAAFPDELHDVLSALMKRLGAKRGKDSPEGRAADAISEIRVKGFPAWDAAEVDVTLYLLCRREDYEGIATGGEPRPEDIWLEQKDRWARLVDLSDQGSSGAIRSLDISVELLEEMSAAAYIDSDMLDLGGMSPQPG